MNWPPEIAPPRADIPDTLEPRRVMVPAGVHHRVVKDLLIRAGIAITGMHSSGESQSYTVKVEDVERARQLVAEMSRRG